jgi:hypothetical protein
MESAGWPLLVKLAPVTEAKASAKQACRRGGGGAQVAGYDGLREHANCAEPEQQPDHDVDAERRRPVGDRAAQAVAMVGPIVM